MYRMKYPIGRVPSEVQLASSKKYKRGVKYLHFFKHLHDLPTVRNLERKNGASFVGKFDIPLRSLISGNGVGKYTGTPITGTDKYIVVKEFAVPLKEINYEYFVDFIFDEKGDLTIEEVSEFFEENEKELGEE